MKDHGLIFKADMVRGKEVDWTKPDWAYLLGVVHGDGHVSKRSISVNFGFANRVYFLVIVDIWKKLGFDPKVYYVKNNAFRLDVHNKELRDVFIKYKKDGIWGWPNHISVRDYLSGLIDTDGYMGLSYSKKHKGISKKIGIEVKRNGNLPYVADLFRNEGVEVDAKNAMTTYKGEPYETEVIRICSAEKIVKAAKLLRLRNPRKISKLAELKIISQEQLNRVSKWKEVGLWMQKEGPKTQREIEVKFHLTKRQADALLQQIKKNATVKKLPPITTRYIVSGL